MKKQISYRQHFTRRNNLKENWVAFLLSVCSFPKLLIEVFIRTQFGRRYFNLASAFSVAAMLFFAPFFLHTVDTLIGYQPGDGFQVERFFKHYFTWYAFLTAFIVKSIKRRREIKRLRGEFDFDWFSQSSGIIDSEFYYFKLNGKTPTTRQVEIFLEPLPALIVGLVLALLSQPLGLLLIVVSLIYGLSYAAAYYRGDCRIMDINDNRIVNKVLEEVFVDDTKPEQANGFTIRGKRPTSRELRNELYQTIREEDDDVPEVV